MNVTIFNSTEELVGQLFLGGTAFSVCAYAIGVSAELGVNPEVWS